MNFLVLLPGLWTAALATFKGWRVALIYGFLPSLIFFPNYYIFKMNGVPELSFWSSSLLALFVFWMVQGGWRGLRFEVLDAVVLAYCLWCVLAEGDANGAKEAQNLFGKLALGTLAPYLLARSMRRDSQLLWNCVKMLAVYAAFLFLLAPYEARMGRNPFDVWRAVMPNTDWTYALYRNGVRRVVGSFSHSICYGYFAMMVLPLAIWLHVTRSFASRWTSAAIIAMTLMGLALSGSRGAALGAVITIGTMTVLWAPHRKFTIPVATVTILISAFLIWPAMQELMQMNRNDGETESAQTAAYRAEMIRDYYTVCRQVPWFGLGRGNVPVIANMKSIDNQYLLLSLLYGFPAAALLVLAGLVGMAAQLPSVLMRSHANPWCRFDAILVAAIAGALGLQITVYAGTQTEQLFFMFLGLAASPRIIGLTLRPFMATELPPLAAGARVATTPLNRAGEWWKRAVLLPRAQHAAMPGFQNAAGIAFDGAVPGSSAQPVLTCENCVHYPPIENATESGSWFTRFFNRVARRKAGPKPNLKPGCRECGLYRNCALARRLAAEETPKD